MYKFLAIEQLEKMLEAQKQSRQRMLDSAANAREAGNEAAARGFEKVVEYANAEINCIERSIAARS